MTASSESEPFHAVAPYYDRLMSGIPYFWWFRYIEALVAYAMELLDESDRSGRAELSEAPRWPQTVLDLCCGTGSLTELFYTHGYQVVGVDISAPMIEQARRKAEEQGYRIPYYVQDASELELPSTFDLVVSVFDSLNNITEPARFAQCMQRVYRHLNANGVFIFDLNTEYAFVHKMFDQSERRRTSPVRYRWRSEYDPSTHLCTVRMEFWVDEDDGERYFVEVHRQRAYSDAEVRTMLKEAGFRAVHAFDAYTIHPPTRRSDRVFYVAPR